LSLLAYTTHTELGEYQHTDGRTTSKTENKKRSGKGWWVVRAEGRTGTTYVEGGVEEKGGEIGGGFKR
jgi:hypothetical protein